MTTAALKVDVMIQARMGSSRLPGKIMLPLGAGTALGTMIERVKRVRNARQVVVLTTRRPEDEAVTTLAASHGVQGFRGEVDDVLDRFYRAALAHDTDVIVRLTGDCPFMDPRIVDDMLDVYLFNWPRIEFLTNCYRRTYARGMDVEILSRSLLERLHQRCREPHYREHVIPYVEEHPEEFAFFEWPNVVDESRYRLTLDTKADYETIVNVYEVFGHDRFSYRELIEALERQPHLVVNAAVVHKAYRC
jgi:spore coat polysaccharide biosynthesis protein SpsF